MKYTQHIDLELRTIAELQMYLDLQHTALDLDLSLHDVIISALIAALVQLHKRGLIPAKLPAHADRAGILPLI